jgi:hypothetical protein
LPQVRSAQASAAGTVAGRICEGSISLVKDLSALTPPFLIAAVVIIAIVAFLRHEMGRGRVDHAEPDDNSAPDADSEQDS